MRRLWLLLPFVLAVGCKSTEGGKGTAKPDDAGKGTHWLDGPKPDWAKGDVPKAGTWADPRDPKFDYANYVKGALAGYVLDLSEKPAANAIITVESADPAAGQSSSPMVVLADGNGAFVVHGLKSNETYALTAKVRDGSEVYVGQTFATPPSVHVRIRLKDHLSLPAGQGFGNPDALPSATSPIGTPGPSVGAVPAPRPSGDLPPLPGGASALPAPAPLSRDGAVSPRDARGGDRGWSPIPTPGGNPTDNVLPLPSATIPVRPDLNTGTPQPDWRPPAANVPNPPPPTIAPPPPKVPSGLQQSGLRATRKESFTLLDTAGRPVEFPGPRGELVLLDFMTTSCLPCKRSLPEMIEFQRRYAANGLEVVGVCCDESPEADRRSAAAKYQKENGLNYLLYTEAKPSAVRKMFRVDRYPTLVLIDGTGEVLWSGHPKDMAELERVVRASLQRP